MNPNYLHTATKPNSKHDQNLDRVLGVCDQNKPGPLIFLVCNLKGDQAFPRMAVKRMFQNIIKSNTNVNGRIVGLAANVEATRLGVESISSDLSKLWTNSNIEHILSRGGVDAEEKEAKELLDEIFKELAHSDRKVLFLELRTCSDQIQPFLVVPDSKPLKKLAISIDQPAIVGMEKFRKGNFIDYFNHKNYSALTIEGGKKTSPQSLVNLESITALLLANLGVISKKDINYTGRKKALKSLQVNGVKGGIYKVENKYQVSKASRFYMNMSAKTFEPVFKGELLAKEANEFVVAPRNGRLFIPESRTTNDRGFYVIRKKRSFGILDSLQLKNLFKIEDTDTGFGNTLLDNNLQSRLTKLASKAELEVEKTLKGRVKSHSRGTT